MIRAAVLLLAGAVGLLPASAAPDSTGAPPRIRLAGPPSLVFEAPRQACDGDDVPDAPARAFHLADGSVRMFGLHTKNRSLVGPDLADVRIDCKPALVSHGNPDPAAYDDESWITATWTFDGRRIDALIHHEYQGNEHPGRCRFPDYMQCWFNTILAARSDDGGASFVKDPHPVVASAPFRQDIDQGRHRGFFNPSNMVSDGTATYFLASTTGWEGQPNGVCLFRSLSPADPQSWRAFDGAGFSVSSRDPYRTSATVRPPPCVPVGPFPAPVGSVTRQRSTGSWIAVFQASADKALFPVPGFYASQSRDLLHWGPPRLIVPGKTLYDDACTSGGRMIAYPSILDPRDPSRNFDQTGDHPDLFYTVLVVDGCTVTGRRTLIRQPLDLLAP